MSSANHNHADWQTCNPFCPANRPPENPVASASRRHFLRQAGITGGAALAGAALMGALNRNAVAAPSPTAQSIFSQWMDELTPQMLVWYDSNGAAYVKDCGVGSLIGELVVQANVITAYGATLGAGTAGTSTSTSGIQEANNSLTSGRTWKEQILVKGSTQISSTIFLSSHTQLKVLGLLLNAAANLGNPILSVGNYAGGAPFPNYYDVEVVGGIYDGNANYMPVASTNVNSQSNSGQKTLNVDNSAGFVSGQVVAIGVFNPAGTYESNVVSSVGTGTITLLNNLTNTHYQGDVVFGFTLSSYVNGASNSGQATVAVASTTSFTSGQYVVIGRYTIREEIGKISSITPGTSITLTTNLVNSHSSAQADIVTQFNSTPSLYAAGQSFPAYTGIGGTNYTVSNPVGNYYNASRANIVIMNCQDFAIHGTISRNALGQGLSWNGFETSSTGYPLGSGTSRGWIWHYLANDNVGHGYETYSGARNITGNGIISYYNGQGSISPNSSFGTYYGVQCYGSHYSLMSWTHHDIQLTDYESVNHINGACLWFAGASEFNNKIDITSVNDGAAPGSGSAGGSIIGAAGSTSFRDNDIMVKFRCEAGIQNNQPIVSLGAIAHDNTFTLNGDIGDNSTYGWTALYKETAGSTHNLINVDIEGTSTVATTLFQVPNPMTSRIMGRRNRQQSYYAAGTVSPSTGTPFVNNQGSDQFFIFTDPNNASTTTMAITPSGQSATSARSLLKAQIVPFLLHPGDSVTFTNASGMGTCDRVPWG